MKFVRKPLPYGISNPTQWWGTPISPSHPLRQSYNQIPWGATMPYWLASQNGRVRNGRGQLVHVTGLHTADTPFTITHALGRYPQAIFNFGNNATQQYPSRVRFASGTQNSQQCTIAFENQTTDTWLWIL